MRERYDRGYVDEGYDDIEVDYERLGQDRQGYYGTEVGDSVRGFRRAIYGRLDYPGGYGEPGFPSFGAGSRGRGRGRTYYGGNLGEPRWGEQARAGRDRAERAPERHYRERPYEGHRARGPNTGRGPRGYRRSDERIAEDVNDILWQHDDIDASDIEVSVRDGEVTLAGTVDSRRTKRLAEDLVDAVTGVVDVHNRLCISPDYPATGRQQGGGMKDDREEQRRESGMPGGGKGRKDMVGRTGVYPVSRSEGASPDAVIHDQASFGQGARGAEGYEDSGGSELFYYEAELKERDASAPGVFDSNIREGRIDMKVLKPLPHSIMDYVWAGTMMAAPWLFGFRKNKRATINSISAGAGILGLSLMTKYPLGAVKLIPFPVHGVIEAVAGGLTALDPWILGFSDNKQARWTHVIAGLGTLAVVAMTDYQAAESGARRSFAGGRGAGLAEQMRFQPELTPEPAPDLGPPTHLPEDVGSKAARATKSRA